MAVIGVDLDQDELVLTRNRDFRWNFVHLNSSGVEEDYPAGSLYFELATSPLTTWTFSIDGAEASLKVESDQVNLIPNRCKWQLVFRPSGEVAGGDPIARGIVRVQH